MTQKCCNVLFHSVKSTVSLDIIQAENFPHHLKDIWILQIESTWSKVLSCTVSTLLLSLKDILVQHFLFSTYCRQGEEGNGKHRETGRNSLPDPRLWHFVSVSDGGHCHLRREREKIITGNPILPVSNEMLTSRVNNLTFTSSDW